MAGAAAALVAAGLLLVGGGAGVVSAQETLRFDVTTGFDRTVPVRSDGHGDAYRPLSVHFATPGSGTLREVRITVDGSQLAGTAEFDLPDGCVRDSATPLKLVCDLGDAAHGFGGLDVGVRAAQGAQAGASGRVAFTVTAANGTATPGSSDSATVTVGDGPDLAINDLGAQLKIAPGTESAVRLEMTNAGSQDAKGVVVFLRAGFDNVGILGNHSNCVYESRSGAQRGVFCTFPDAVVKPGETYALKTPVTLTVPQGARGDVIQYGDALIGNDWTGEPEGTPGTGAPLELVPAQAALRTFDAEPAQDIDEYNNLNYTEISTGEVKDVAAVGGTVQAAIGAQADAVFRVRNTGTVPTGAVNSDGRPGVQIWALFPSNVKVLSAPKGCTKQQAGPEELAAYPLDRAHPETVWTYGCSRRAALKPGQDVAFTFRVSHLKAVDDSYAGVVAFGDEDFLADRGNNVARLSFTAAADDGTAPAGGRDDLADTGGSGTTPWLAGGGALTVVLGVSIVLAARRRRSAGA
ncbi:LAETG motif-containing sortase-dependent surface protein [Streptomyces polyrhachis]|uniref:LAETG motif-containing sortase-dependent surface protein n=1 Tax=Streptomyces polyrhachis TaxID=1282885 RepID=A0ABW2GMW5_9ACTN